MMESGPLIESGAGMLISPTKRGFADRTVLRSPDSIRLPDEHGG
jgi:hypothetical protein